MQEGVWFLLQSWNLLYLGISSILKPQPLVFKHLEQLTIVFKNKIWQVYSSTPAFRISMYDWPATVYFRVKNTNKLVFSFNYNGLKKVRILSGLRTEEGL